MANRWGIMEIVTGFIFLSSKIIVDCDCSHEIKWCLLLGRKVLTNLDSILKCRDVSLPTKVHLVRYGFPRSHVWMWELDHKKGWVLKNWCFWTVVLEKTLESPLNWKEIKPVNLKGNQLWVFFGRTDAEAPIFWPPYVKNWFNGKVPDAGKDWRQEEKGTTEDEMVGRHHRLNGREFDKFQEMVKDREAWLAAVPGLANCWTWLSNSTATIAPLGLKHVFWAPSMC